MTPHQRTAYAAPCFEAEQYLDPRFYRLRDGLSLGLTCNVGLE
jgi:hypothetical protein